MSAPLKEAILAPPLMGVDELRELVEDRLQAHLDTRILMPDLRWDSSPVATCSDPQRDRLRSFVDSMEPDPITVRIPWSHLAGRMPAFSATDDVQRVSALYLRRRLQWRVEPWAVDSLGVVAWLMFDQDLTK